MQFDSSLLDEIAYTEGGQSVSFRALFQEANGLSKVIESEFKGSEFIGIRLKTSPRLLILILSTWMADKVPVLFHPRFPSETVGSLIDHVGLKDPVIEEARLKELLSKSKPEKSFQTTFEDSKIASVVFTSGSTGLPKAVAHSFGNHFASALGAHENISFEKGDRWAASLPMCHVGGLSLFFRSLIRGGTISFLDKELSFEDAIVASRATHLSFIPTQLLSLVDSQVSFLRNLKVLLIGGAPMPDFLFEKCVDKKIPIRLTYGMTETASQLATGNLLEKNAGQVLNYRKMTLVDSQIFVGGDVLFQGYIEKGQLQKREGEWFASGDRGRFDVDGNLLVIGRIDNMFISGGENIQPEQIEKAMLDLGLFSEVVVVPISDPKFGYRPFAFVDSLCDLRVLYEGLLEKLPKFMWPVGIQILPEREGLKVSRSALIKLLE